MNNHTPITQDEWEDIERYVLNKMPAEEYDRFTNQIAGNNRLQQQVSEVRSTIVGVQEYTLQEKLDDFHAQLSTEITQVANNQTYQLKKWFWAAAILLLIATAAVLIVGRYTKDAALYSRYYKPDPGMLTSMGVSDNYDFDRAMVDYKTGEYEKALQAWQQLLSSNTNNDTLVYFIGSAYLANNNPGKAILYLKKVAENRTSYFAADANWYTGLALIKAGKKSEAAKYIERSDRQNKAALLHRLEEE